MCGEAIQAYGGYGYCEEYPVAQIARDMKIYSIWEGTNYIQSLDLVGRKWAWKMARYLRTSFRKSGTFTPLTKIQSNLKGI